MRRGVERSVQFHMPPENNDMLWRVHRENLIFLAGERALHMEILDPRIAESLVRKNRDSHTGRFQRNPLKRLYETADFGLKLIFGTQEEAEAAAKKINAMHRKAHGKMEKGVGIYPAGTEYNAFDPDQMKWIAATLLDSSLVGYETFVRPLSTTEKDRYVQQASQLFKILHFNPELMPKTYQGLQEYIQGRIDRGELVMGENARLLAPYISLRHGPVWRKLTAGLHLFNVYTLPPEIRREFGYSQSERQEKLMNQASHGFQKAVPYIPRELRHPLIFLRNKRILKRKDS